jgi:predicted alpha/beta hydrolase family esterase
MTKIDVLFFHGAGEGAHAEDAAMAASLADHLGEDYRVRIPQLPVPGDPKYHRWGAVIGASISAAREPLVLVGHSFGGYMLLKYLTQEQPEVDVAAIGVIAAPIPGGDPDWTWKDFHLPDNFARALPDAPVFLYASEDDEWVPFAHRDLYAAAIPGSVTRTTTGGHQLGDDLHAVADDIRSVVASAQ